MSLVTKFHHGRILQGDVLEQLDKLEPESVDTVISSPPYYGLRDYSIDGQWGLEKDYHEYLGKLGQMMQRIRIVLKKTGTVWINLGDTYASTPVGRFNGGGEVLRNRDKTAIESSGKLDKTGLGIETKSQLGIPHRFYIQCIDDGWIARNFIPWIKENSMPSSVKDRFTNKWEPVMFFAKQQKYYFNLDAVREKPKTEYKSFNKDARDQLTGRYNEKFGVLGRQRSLKELSQYNKDGTRKQDNVLGADGKPKLNYKGFNKRWKEKLLEEGRPASSARTQSKLHEANETLERGALMNSKGKNPGDVFRINPHPFPEAHFATFPVELPLKILKCACPAGGICLDPFFGAGTVAVAAEKLALNWIGIEISEKYIDIAKKRLEPYNISRLTEFF